MKLDDFDYDLPKELIAQKTASPKDSSRLMVVKDNKIFHKHFYDLVDYLEQDDVLVVNTSKVSRAKIIGKKITGSAVEIIITEKIDDFTFNCRIKGNKIRIGNNYEFPGGIMAELLYADKDLFTIKFNKKITDEITEKYFSLPLPPYVKDKVEDKLYQTVYSKTAGSLAAPTAGLHFTEELLERIRKKGVKITEITLHIDFGTFLPIKTDNFSEHKMHREYYEITQENADIINNRKGRLIVIGTTTIRTLESAAEDDGTIPPKKGHTEIFIYPGYQFKTKIDCLVTNFHLPKSTLLLLVSAFYDKDKLLHAYNEAVKEKYRFYSLGDAMFIIK